MQWRTFLIAVLTVWPFLHRAQEATNDTLFPPPLGPRYLEDQLFFQFSYITLKNLYPGIVQQGFSNSVSFGFIRDVPVNSRRNVGFGIGLGYERNVYYQNLRIKVDEGTGEVSFEILDPARYRLNAFGMKRLIVPVEFRVRGSTPKKFKFWRLYAGVTFGYTLGAFSDYDNGRVWIRYRNLNRLPSKYQYGVHIYGGYAELNAYIYAGLNDLFSPDVKVNGEHVPLQDLRFGVMLTFL
ncbi:MAG: PorT family protein [Chlorobi bacterium]|nr:PorT family protein [Chlorobiota bacterium]